LTGLIIGIGFHGYTKVSDVFVQAKMDRVERPDWSNTLHPVCRGNTKEAE